MIKFIIGLAVGFIIAAGSNCSLVKEGREYFSFNLFLLAMGFGLVIGLLFGALPSIINGTLFDRREKEEWWQRGDPPPWENNNKP